MITVNKANPTQGEITSSLTGSTGDGGGLHLANGGKVELANSAAAEFGTSDFSLEFVLNQTGDNASDNYIYFTHGSGNSRLYIYNDISADVLKLNFEDSSGSLTTKTLSYDMSADYGTPTHYVLTFDRDANATLYKNGSSVASVDISAVSSIDIGDGNADAGQFGSSGSYGVLGTFYRFRTWNKLVDAKALFERADVDFVDQYGSQTNKISAAVDKNWGTNQADSGNDANDRATFNANYAWTVNGTSVVDISVASNVLTFSARYNKHGIYYNASLVAGKRQRITLNVTTVGTGEFGLYYYTGSAYALITTLVAGENSVEFVPTATNGYVYLGCTADHASAKQIVLNAASIANSIVPCGCVSDYDLAFANPTQSLTVQDRAGAADGTCSASGVTQVNSVVQLNTEQLSVGGTNAKVGIGLAAGSNPQEMLHIDGISPRIRLRDSDASGTPISTIDASGGGILISADANDETTGSDIRLATDGTTHFTLDSSGDSTFSGDVKITGTNPALGLYSTNSSPQVNLGNAAGTNHWSIYETVAADGSQGSLNFYDAVSTSSRLTISSTGLATFTGGISNEQGIYGGQITIADDAVGTITPPRQGVMMAISYSNNTDYPTHETYVGIFWCDTGASQNVTKITSQGGGITTHNGVDLTAVGESSSVDGHLNISTISGTIQLKNRISGSVSWWYNFIA